VNVGKKSGALLQKARAGKNQNAIGHSMRHRMPQSFDECDDGASVATPIRA
jgi:hypothetical protein